jgi:uncharacterized phage infection (PIP) family protein YhgE
MLATGLPLQVLAAQASEGPQDEDKFETPKTPAITTPVPPKLPAVTAPKGVTVKSVAPVVPAAPAVTPPITKEEARDLKDAMERLSENLADAKQRMARIEENNTEVKAGLADLKSRLDVMDLKMEKTETDRRQQEGNILKKEDLQVMQDTLAKLKTDNERVAGQLKEMESQLKKGDDQTSGLNDMLTVLKKDVSDNDTEVVSLKKQIRNLSAAPAAESKKGSEIDEFLNWPYWGITAMGLAIIAMFVAVQPKK